MNTQPIIDTKGSGKGSKTVMLVLGLSIIIGGIIFSVFGLGSLDSNADEMTVLMIIIGSFAPLLIGIALIAISFGWAGTYVQVFPDHMEGKALVQVAKNNRKESFYFAFNCISHITLESNVLKIHADGKEYKILTSSKYGNEVFRFYNSVQQASRPAVAPQYINPQLRK